jgi:uncharacterized repeat protein (TIGR03803 family)
MATDNAARQLSSSWGFGSQTDPAREQIFLQFAAQGQSFFQASGDQGAWTGAVAPPSDDPMITVVGGTSLTTSQPSGAWVSETTWPLSGGGISTSYPIPDWQVCAVSQTNQASAQMRNVPDVAALADSVIWIVANNGEQGTVGGTSASAPLWAGFAALANEQAALQDKPPLGFINPALYALGRTTAYPAAFHDISTGNNTNSSSHNKFLATPGYDLCTGWGSPAGARLIDALVSPPAMLTISPASDAIFTGPAGGPFSPQTATWSLTNNGVVSFGWALGTTNTWLTPSLATGTLSPGGPAASVAVSLTPVASGLAPGAYTASLWFTNACDKTVQSRRVTLNIVNLPIITSQPLDRTVLEGSTVSFNVGIASNAAVAFHWYWDNGLYPAPLPGATAASLTLSNVTTANAGGYYAVLSNAAGTVTSSTAYLGVVSWRPLITAQPASQTAWPGQSVSFRVQAQGSQPLFYRWQHNGTNLSDGGNLSGATSSQLTVSRVAAQDAGSYSVMVGNGYGLAPSSSATLDVTSITDPDTALASLYAFTDGNDGASPNGLLLASDGRFYGTAQHGGTNDSGTVFTFTPGQPPATLYSFSGGNDGAAPFGRLLQSTSGAFYGTTVQGGSNDNGSLFKITATGALTPLAAFTMTNGSMPYSGLFAANDGSFYGTTYKGGSSIYGTVFQVDDSGLLVSRHSFTNGNEGGYPCAGVVQDSDGSFYGTTFKGGARGLGTLYKMLTHGLVIPLVAFNSTNGSYPVAGLTRGNDDCLYGAASYGGLSNKGTLFKMNPSGNLTLLHSFSGGSEGAQPQADLTLGSDGNFYGTTVSGGSCNLGTVFRVSPDGAFATLIAFDGFNGANPQTPLAEGTNGEFFGTTEYGGDADWGVIFSFHNTSAPRFTCQPASRSAYVGDTVRLAPAVAGSAPLAWQWRLNGTNLADSGNIFGSTSRVLTLTNVTLANAGTYSVLVTNSLGSVLSAEAVLQVTSSAPVLLTQPASQNHAPGDTAFLSVSAAGNAPLTYQWQINGTNLADGGNLFGARTSTLILTNVAEANNGAYSVIVSNSLASTASSNALLTIIPVSAADTRVTTLRYFDGAQDGATPSGLARASKGLLYGTTRSGGAQNAGTLFALSPGGAFATLAALSSTVGSTPLCPPVEGTNSMLFGVASLGGSGNGTIFEMTPDGAPANLYSFGGTPDGAHPSAALIQGTDGLLYGTTPDGGAFGHGSLFKLTTDGAFSLLYSFTNGMDGAAPVGSLAQGPDGALYGMSAGGTNGCGNIFRVTTAGQLSVLRAFKMDNNGYGPVGALALGSDGNFYGLTEYSKLSVYTFCGSVFRISPSGTFLSLYTLNYMDGTYPHAGLIQASDGNFYGTTCHDNVAGNGTVFRVTPAGVVTTLLTFDGFDTGANPEAALVEGPDGNLYGATTTGGVGGCGTVFRLSFTAAPRLITPPVAHTVLAGATVSFEVTVTGASPLSWQWLKNGTNIPPSRCATNGRVLTLTNVTAADAGSYSVRVANPLNSITSSSAALTVISNPVLQVALQTNKTLLLNWNTFPTQKYQLQFSPDLTSGWSNLGALITARSNTATASDPMGANTRRFYRVVLYPQVQ